MKQLSFLCVLAMATWGQAWAAAGTVQDASGEVTAQMGKAKPQALAKAGSFESGSVISTGKDSSAVLKFEDGHTIVLQPNSSFRIDRYRYAPEAPKENSAIFSFLKGGLRSITGLLGQQRKEAFSLKTPQATIGIRGTDIFTVLRGKTMFTQVNDGAIVLNNGGGSLLMNKGQVSRVMGKNALGSLVDPSAIPKGTFDQLNKIQIPQSPTPGVSLPSAPPVPPVAAGIVAAGVGVGAVSAAGGLASALIPASDEKKEDPALAQAKAAEEAKAAEAAKAAEEAAKAAEAEKARQAAEDAAKAAQVAQALNEHTGATEEPQEDPRSGWAVSLNAGTLGAGVELHKRVADNFSVRLGYTGATLKKDGDFENNPYHVEFKLGGPKALLDWYVFSGGFRLSAGAVASQNKLTMRATPGAGSTFTLDGVQYSGDKIQEANGLLDFKSTAPYLGWGWGNPAYKGKGFGFMVDMGVIMHKTPKLDYTVTCSALASPTECQAIQASTVNEKADLQKNLEKLRFWPVVELGLSYQF